VRVSIDERGGLAVVSDVRTGAAEVGVAWDAVDGRVRQSGAEAGSGAWFGRTSTSGEARERRESLQSRAGACRPKASST